MDAGGTFAEPRAIAVRPNTLLIRFRQPKPRGRTPGLSPLSGAAPDAFLAGWVSRPEPVRFSYGLATWNEFLLPKQTLEPLHFNLQFA